MQFHVECFHVVLHHAASCHVTSCQAGHAKHLSLLQAVQEAQQWCYSITGGTELPTLLHLSDEGLTQYITSLQVCPMPLGPFPMAKMCDMLFDDPSWCPCFAHDML